MNEQQRCHEEAVRILLAKVSKGVDDVLNEVACQNLGAGDHALIEEARQRIHERLVLLAPVPDVKHSGR